MSGANDRQLERNQIGGSQKNAVRGIETRRPGETVTLEVYRDGSRRQVRVKLGTRPVQVPTGG